MSEMADNADTADATSTKTARDKTSAAAAAATIMEICNTYRVFHTDVLQFLQHFTHTADIWSCQRLQFPSDSLFVPAIILCTVGRHWCVCMEQFTFTYYFLTPSPVLTGFYRAMLAQSAVMRQ